MESTYTWLISDEEYGLFMKDNKNNRVFLRLVYPVIHDVEEDCEVPFRALEIEPLNTHEYSEKEFNDLVVTYVHSTRYCNAITCQCTQEIAKRKFAGKYLQQTLKTFLTFRDQVITDTTVREDLFARIEALRQFVEETLC